MLPEIKFARASHSLKKYLLLCSLIVVVVGLCWPQHFTMPVAGADSRSYHPQSFWYYPWGKSGTHKGVDVFAKEGTHVLSSTGGIVLFTGEINRGGNVTLVLGPKWRLHYYAHLDEITAGSFDFVSRGEQLGTVGTTGNAKGKAPHLHYSIMTLIPYPWKADTSVQGWKKMFYLNPILFLKEVDH
jgi:peptidoglycan LD-endopeptidase LytH